MKKTNVLLIILIALIIIAVGLWLFLFVSNDADFVESNKEQTQNTEEEKPDDIIEEADFGNESERVVINDEGINPPEVTIKTRNSVIFENNTEGQISLIADSDELELSTIEEGERYHTNLLSNPGEYTYTVSETGEEGRIIVNE